MSSTEQKRMILVTGANRGIGFLIVKKLAKDSPSNRSPSNVHVLQLDTSSRESIIRAKDEIKQKYGGQLDVVINNAAVTMKDLNVNAAREILGTNYYGVKILNEYLFPLMREGGRIINVSSRIGPIVLYKASQALQERYTSSTLTKYQIDQLVEEFISAIETNSLENIGYNAEPSFLMYGVSKAALNALTQVEAYEWSNIKNLLVVSVTPGFCATDMTGHAPDVRPAKLGADSILYMVNALRSELKNGGFYADGQQIPLISAPIV
ncbi:unnamed protein product [Rotaria socialis]